MVCRYKHGQTYYQTHQLSKSVETNLRYFKNGIFWDQIWPKLDPNGMPGQEWARMLPNSFHIKKIYWKLHRNLMNQIEDLMSNVYFGHRVINISPLFFPFSFRSMIEDHGNIHFSQQKVLNSKNSIFGSFWALLSQMWANEILFKTRSPSLLRIYRLLTSCKELEKNDDRFWRTNKRTNMNL